jgi:hypothetical protein
MTAKNNGEIRIKIPKEDYAYKGFDALKRDGGYVCTDKRYELNRWHTHPRTPSVCEHGLHACRCPVMVLPHY